MGAQLKPKYFRGQRALADTAAGIDPDFDDEPLDLSAGALATSYHLGEEFGGGDLSHCNTLVSYKQGIFRNWPADEIPRITVTTAFMRPALTRAAAPRRFLPVGKAHPPPLELPIWAAKLFDEVVRICVRGGQRVHTLTVELRGGGQKIRLENAINGRWCETQPPLEEAEAAVIAIYLMGGGKPQPQ